MMKKCVLVVIVWGVCGIGVSAETLKFVTGNEYPPFTDEHLPNGGMITEMIVRIFQELGYSLEIAFYPWARGYEETKKGKYVGTFPYVKNEKRVQDFNYSEPMYTITTRFFVRQDFSSEYLQDEDLKGMRVCKPLGYNLSDIQPLLDKQLVTVSRPTQMTNCVQMLQKGRVQLLPINEHVGWAILIEEFGEDATTQFKTLDKPLQEDHLYLIISKTSPNGEELLAKFNEGLQRLKDQGTWHDIITRHFAYRARREK
ncbi:MAG: amino acid ABC transporter substrate-binding protein [bacterium]|nr:amino acid ABC transporter substrate-binding protein [bacterium]